MWSFSDSDLDVTSNHQEQFNTPCIASPFGATAPPGLQRKRSFNHGISRKSNKSMSKKSLQQWLRLQEVHHRIRDCEDENEKFELYISFGDRLADIGRFSKALCSYGQAFDLAKNSDQDLGHESFVYFMQVMSKVVESNAVEFQSRKKKDLNGSRQTENFENQDQYQAGEQNNQRKYYEALVGEPCDDPFSCPSCSGVLNDPVTIACGHTFCRQHVMSNTANVSLCLKCKAPWRREEPRLIVSETGELKRHQSTPEQDLKDIATNTLINSLVHTYWSDDLTAIELRNKANKAYSERKYEEALVLYNRAFSLSPNDHLILGNRSIAHLKSGDVKSALEDAELAVSLRPDWAKGHLRRGQALKTLRRHEEAFKALFSCLVLEKSALSKPVKQELAKELHQLLRIANECASEQPNYYLKQREKNSIRLLDEHEIDDLERSGMRSRSGTADSECSLKSSTGSSDSLSVLDTFNPKDLPTCLMELGQYLDKISDESSNEDLTNNTNNAGQNANQLDEDDILTSFGENEPTNWLTIHQQKLQRPYRELNMESVKTDDYECPLCMRTLWKPITTPCGHTFCKTCLDRVLDHNTNCPMCKSAALKSYLSERRETNANEFVENQLKLHLPTDYAERMKIHENEMQQLAGQDDDTSKGQVPIFVCTMSFPSIPCPLHVFEPRYRLMIRRCMEVGTREFGMCCHVGNNQPFADFGTMLEVRDIQFFPDGRSIVDTMGGRRFKVIERGVMDGYNTAKVEFLEDEKVPEDQVQELIKVHDETLAQTKSWFASSSDFVRKGIVDHYGQLPDTEQDYWTMPNGPTWLWWVLNTLPIDPPLKLLLLSKTSLKERLENTRRILRFLAKAGKNKTK